MRLDRAAHHLVEQDGVITRAQLLQAGVTPAELETCLRRRELVPIHPGVYINHSSTPTWKQRAWAAVLYAGRAALHLESALHRDGKGTAATGPIDVAVDWSRKVRPQPGIRVHRVRDLEAKATWNTSPPRVRLEEAVVTLADRAADDLRAIAVLTSVVGQRRTIASRLATTIEGRPRLRRRALLTSLLVDLERGTHSVLEHGFLSRVVRPHGLPEPYEQQGLRHGMSGAEYRDIDYDEMELVIEMDGRTHDSPDARDIDADRDLDDLSAGHVVPRIRYRQVFGTPCRTATRLESLFRLRGWDGAAHPCDDPGCDLRAQAPAPQN